MIVNNELVNRLVRNGESHATFSIKPHINDIIDRKGRLKQTGPRLPVLDAIRAVLYRASQLYPGKVHTEGDSAITVSKEIWQELIFSLERIEPEQPDATELKPTKIKQEVLNANQAYRVAVSALTKLANDDNVSMDDYIGLLRESSNPDLTTAILCGAGPDNGGWTTAEGQLPPLKIEFPETLRTKNDVELKGYVRDVDDTNGVALIEVEGYRTEHVENLLRHHPSLVRMQFDKESVERDDLVAIQYREQPVWFRVSAVCATAPRYARKSELSLTRILMDRQSLDTWHTRARQLPFEFEGSD